MKYGNIANTAPFAKYRKMYRIPHIEKKGQKFIPVTCNSQLGDWTVPKISLYLHPISAEDYMEPFLEFSSFSRYLGLFLMKFLMILEESSKSHQKSPRNRLKIEISKKGSVRSSTDGMKVLPILGTIQSPYSELQVTGTNFWTFYFYKNTQGSNSEKLRIS